MQSTTRRRGAYAAIAGLLAAVVAVGVRDGDGEVLELLEKVLEEVSYTASDRDGETINIDAAYVKDRIGGLAQNTDLSRFIL